MLARALIVLLVVLNLGVAAWWMARDEAAPAAASVEPPAGVARLQLLREVVQGEGAQSPPGVAVAAPTMGGERERPEPEQPAAANPPAADPPVASAPAATQAPLQCYAIGPFSDAGKLAAARDQLQASVARLSTRKVAPANATRREWRVWLPPQADRAAAQAMVDRITAAGFSDYYIVAAGDEANSIALGLYGSEESASRHRAALHAAGFTEVRADALGDAPPPVTWIDVASAKPLAAADAKALGAERVDPLDCATLPAAPATASR